MGESTAKLSVRVPSALASELRRCVGTRGLSGFVARAIAHELEREQLGTFLMELDKDLGPVSNTEMLRARRACSKR